MIFEWCCVFYIVTYRTGAAIYHRLGSSDDLQALKDLSTPICRCWNWSPESS